MSIVKERETFFIQEGLTATGKFSRRVDLRFQPDELRIVQVIYCPPEVAPDNIIYSLDWIGVGKLFFFDNAQNNDNLNIRINVHGKNIQGIQNFQVMEVGGVLEIASTVHSGAYLGFVFEAIKY